MSKLSSWYCGFLGAIIVEVFLCAFGEAIGVLKQKNFLLLGVILLSVVFGHCLANEEGGASFGKQCAAMHVLLRNKQVNADTFANFISNVSDQQRLLSAQEWETASFLTQQYVQECIKNGDKDQALSILHQFLSLVYLPKKVRQECMLVRQRLNPQNLMLRDHLAQLSKTKNVGDSEWDHLLLQVYDITLHSCYDTQKQAILFAKKQNNFAEALSLCAQLSENLNSGACSVHPDLVEIERCFLDKIILMLRIEQALHEHGEYQQWLPRYFDAEEAYVHAAEALVNRIANQKIMRSQEVDEVLLSHALGKMTWDVQTAIKELEVLIDGGYCLSTPVLQYAYFALLEAYYQQRNMSAIERLLCAGKDVFASHHVYEPEYMFFLGCSLYHKHQYKEAADAFHSILSHAPRLGITLARTYEYLGCISCICGDNLSAKQFFLQAYKGWGRNDAQLGLFLIAAKLCDNQLCFELQQQTQISFFYGDLLRKIQSLFLQKNTTDEDRPVYVLNEPCQDLVCGQVLMALMEQGKEDVFRPVLGVLYAAINRKENERLVLALQKHHETLKQSEWQAQVSINDAVNLQYLCQKDSLLSCCYDALRRKDPLAANGLPQFFSPLCSLSQSLVRLAWLCTRDSTQKIPEKFFDHIAMRVYGDRLYFFAYDFHNYSSQQPDAMRHLAAFPSSFPNSSLLPVVYYLLGTADSLALRKVHWFKKALEEFSLIPVGSAHAAAWACIYYQLQLNLAETYMSLGAYEYAATIFEEVKNDWAMRDHPRLSLIQHPSLRRSLEKRWLLGLAYTYEQLQDHEQLTNLFIEYLQHRWSFAHYLQEDVSSGLLPELKFLYQRMLAAS